MSRRLKDFLLLRDVRTADELRDLCRKYEKLWTQDEAYRAARSKRAVSAIDDEDWYDESVEAVGPRYRNPNATTYPNAPIKPQHLLCWNCEEIGHTFWRCPKEQQRLHCFGCGTANVTKKDCKRCNPLNPTADGRTGM